MASTRKDEKRFLDALYRVNRFLAQVYDLHKLLDLIMEEAKQIADAEASSLLLYDKYNNELYFEIAQGEKAEAVKKIRLPLSAGIAGAAAKERKPILVVDCSKDARHFKQADIKTRFKTRNLITIPMIRQGRLIGVIEVLNKKKRKGKTFTKEDVRLLQYFADQAAIAIENAQLIRENLASERMAALGQAIASISHYVKNVLTSAMGATSLIDMALNKGDINILKSSWPILKRSNDTVWDLVQNMLSYSKERKPELTKGNINQLLREVAQESELTAKNNKISLELDLDNAIRDSAFDSTRIRDAIFNMVNNALDACKGRDKAKIRFTSRFDKPNKRIEFRVEDNGSGIPLNIQKKIFEPFFSTKGNKGTGLGLANTRKVIEEHEGTIQVESEEGKGATFIIQLPHIRPTS